MGRPVGAGVPAKQATQCLAPAAPVFAGKPAPTGVTVNDSFQSPLKTQDQLSRRRSGGIGRSSFNGSGRLPLPARYWRIWNT
ncbi:hypothetical protein GEV39_08020 [Pseudomonas sp. NY5710]|nr:hypothetical protein GEV39_08020 [Pseudomonas sp. NY5710]